MKSNRLFLTAVLGAMLGAAACTGNESTPFEPAQPPAFSTVSGSAGGLPDDGWGEHRPSSCEALHAESESEDIGPRGGVLEVGPHRLVVPPGALLRSTRITGRITADSVNSIQFFPEGLHFLVPVRLQLSYANCARLELKHMRVVYTSDDLLRVLELIPSEDRRGNSMVVGFISHFSRYAVAY